MGIVGNQSQRANFEWQVQASGAITANGNSPDYENLYGYGMHLFINVTAVGGTTPNIKFSIDEKDPVSGQYYSIVNDSTGITATGLYRLVIVPTTAPGSLPTNTKAWAGDFLPRLWRVSWTITGTTPSVTCSIGAAVCSQQGT